MKEKYTTEKLIEKLNKASYLAIAIIIIGLLLLTLDDYSGNGKFQLLGELIDNFIMIALGIFLYISNAKKVKLIKENFFEVDDKTLIINEKDKNATFNRENKPKSITINLKTINIISADNIEFIITIDDYSKEVKVRKRIKEQMEILKQYFFA